MPITLPLYGVIYDKEPRLKAEKEAQGFLSRDKEVRDLIKQHIREELNNPKQKVSRIFNFKYPNEEKLREYLEDFIKALEKYEKRCITSGST